MDVVLTKSGDQHYVNMHGNCHVCGTGPYKRIARDTWRPFASNLSRLLSDLARAAGPVYGPYLPGYGLCRGFSPYEVGRDYTCPGPLPSDIFTRPLGAPPVGRFF